MSRKEIAQDPIVRIFDDYSGEELGTKTEPTRYQFNGRTYDLYLSSRSRNEVDAFIEKLTTDAELVRRRRNSSRNSRESRPIRIKDPFTIKDLRTWAESNGHSVSANRRAPNAVIEAFNAAH